MGKVILVTGANGFLGQNLLARLLRNPSNMVVAVGRQDKCVVKTVANNLRYCQLDVTDPRPMERLRDDYHFNTIFHLAAFLSRGDSILNQSLLFNHNVTGTLTLLEVARHHHSHFIFPSTGLVYGNQPGPYREDMELKSGNFYGLSKVLGENLIRFYADKYSLPAVVLRLSVVYGEGQSSYMFLPSLVEALSSGREFPMTPGKQKRDFIHISDVLDVMEAAMDHQLRGTYNLAAGVSRTMAEVALMAADLLEARELVKIGALPYRPQESMDYSLDISRIRKALGWSPRTDVKQGIEKLIQHAQMKAL